MPLIEGEGLSTPAELDILALIGVPQRGQLLRLGASGNPHCKHLMLIQIPFTELLPYLNTYYSIANNTKKILLCFLIGPLSHWGGYRTSTPSLLFWLLSHWGGYRTSTPSLLF